MVGVVAVTVDADVAAVITVDADVVITTAADVAAIVTMAACVYAADGEIAGPIALASTMDMKPDLETDMTQQLTAAQLPSEVPAAAVGTNR